MFRFIPTLHFSSFIVPTRSLKTSEILCESLNSGPACMAKRTSSRLQIAASSVPKLPGMSFVHCGAIAFRLGETKPLQLLSKNRTTVTTSNRLFIKIDHLYKQSRSIIKKLSWRIGLSIPGYASFALPFIALHLICRGHRCRRRWCQTRCFEARGHARPAGRKKRSPCPSLS